MSNTMIPHRRAATGSPKTVSSSGQSIETESSGSHCNKIEDFVEDSTTRTKTKTTTTTSESIDSLLANQLNNLSFHQREAINEEIHGINVDQKYIAETGAVEETPELVRRSFQELQTELDHLRATDDVAFAYNKSQELSHSNNNKSSSSSSPYFGTKDFRIMFLRSDRFDCKKAAVRLCRYAQLVYELYGDFALERECKLSDLTAREQRLLQDGTSQFLPGRDRAGRRIYMHFASDDFQAVSRQSRLRIFEQLFMNILKFDKTTQQRGVVVVMWWHNVTKMDIQEYMVRGQIQRQGSSSLPFRVSAGHYCFPSMESQRNEAFRRMMSRITASLLPHLRMHTGSPMECSYILESFGIDSKQNPMNMATGKVDNTVLLQWLKVCVAREENQINRKTIDCPDRYDILLGRGHVVMNHPGNLMFRNFVQSNVQVYSNFGSKKERTQWTWEVVRKLKRELKGRFLKEEQIGGSGATAWVEVSNEAARSKVRIAFRDAISRQAKDMDNNNNKSNTIGSTAAAAARTKANIVKRSEPTIPTPTPLSSLLSKRDIKELNKNNATELKFEQTNNNRGTLSDPNNFNSTLVVNQPPFDSSSTLNFLNDSSLLNGSSEAKRPRFYDQSNFG